MTTIYDFKALNNKGEEVDMSQYKGKVLMIVNTASKCGFTPQYDGLEALYKKYQDQGLVILGFPCDQFKHQEPGSDEEIAEFCRLNHGVTFPLMKKIDVFGENAHPIFKYLTQQVPNEEVHGLKDRATMKMVDALSKSEGREEGGVRWNFTKFLISKDGSIIKRFAPVAKPVNIMNRKITQNNTKMEAKDQVLQAMREIGAPVNAGKIAEVTGLDRKVVDKAFDALKKEGAIVSPVRCKWEPAK